MRDNRSHGNLEREQIRQLVQLGRERGRRQLEQARRSRAGTGEGTEETRQETRGT